MLSRGIFREMQICSGKINKMSNFINNESKLDSSDESDEIGES